jgi:hypothetical protein
MILNYYHVQCVWRRACTHENRGNFVGQSSSIFRLSSRGWIQTAGFTVGLQLSSPLLSFHCHKIQVSPFQLSNRSLRLSWSFSSTWHILACLLELHSLWVSLLPTGFKVCCGSFPDPSLWGFLEIWPFVISVSIAHSLPYKCFPSRAIL